jgi:hypothetical protein
MGGSHLTRVLDEICAKRGKLVDLQSGNGLEFIGKAMLTGLFEMASR